MKKDKYLRRFTNEVKALDKSREAVAATAEKRTKLIWTVNHGKNGNG